MRQGGGFMKQGETNPERATPLRIFRGGRRLFFVAEVVRLRNRFTAHVRILTNPATKVLNGVVEIGRSTATFGIRCRPIRG